ncbi:MAG: hypothetical protein JWP35_3640 [Caulobacter sp.]|nr:hypothetical protein [Caulobacter sp.]
MEDIPRLRARALQARRLGEEMHNDAERARVLAIAEALDREIAAAELARLAAGRAPR